MSRGWRNLVFSPDAFNLTKEINVVTNLGGWFSQSHVLYIRNALSKNGWKLEWDSRSSNALADMLAKKAFKAICSFSFSSCNLTSILKDLEYMLLMDMSKI